MTRFARAKGSKASNERLPEEATPWSEMKKQLLEKNKEIEESKNRKEALERRNTNYKAFLEEKEKDQEKNMNWADFPETTVSSAKVKTTKKKKSNSSSDDVNSANKKKKHKLSSNISIVEETGKSEGKSQVESDDEPPEEQSSKREIVEEPKIKSKKKLKEKKKSIENHSTHEENNNVTKKRKAVENDGGVSKKLKKGDDKNNKGSTKNKQKTADKKQKKNINENLTEEDLKRIEKKKQRRLKQLEKKKKLKAELKKQKEEQAKNEDNSETKMNDDQKVIENASNSLDPNLYTRQPFDKSNKIMKKKESKVRDNKEHPRKKPFLPHKMFINGKELEIDYVDGFPVKKEDALRLKKLRREMISKGLPRSEINAALKLERRKAEKAFAREKKKVCFHCRKSGHNLSECPELDKNELAQTSASGICFKCGSTEHTHFECKVVRGQEFKYATCFICNEQGHIARQCPDNARGLYPKGGACNVCGDVTHLKRDCPKYQAQQQKQEENLSIETLGNSNPDILDEKSDDRIGPIRQKRPNKIIKF